MTESGPKVPAVLHTPAPERLPTATTSCARPHSAY
jgi:hypothetical protein